MIATGLFCLVVDSEVSHTGCAGVSTSGGNQKTLDPGNITVRGNNIHHIALWKRTYAKYLASCFD
jgi:hypothetical protein